MTTQDFIEKYGHGELYTSYGVKNKDGAFVPVVDIKTAIRAIKEIVKLKCAEQRQICANEAKIQYEKDDRHPSHWFESIDKDSILNAPEPEI